MNGEEYSSALERFRAFLRTEPVIPILSRNLSFLPDGGRLVETIELNDGLRCYTEGKKVVIGGAEALLRDAFEPGHWLAAMRAMLAHEVQHANSSDRQVLDALRTWYGGALGDGGVPFRVGSVLGQKVLNILEDGRINNLVCQRFPGYVPLMRFTAYANCAWLAERGRDSDGAKNELTDFLTGMERYALTGEDTGFGPQTEARETIRRCIDRAVLAQTAEACADECRTLLTACAPYLAEICGRIVDLDTFVEQLSLTLQDYPYSALERAEQTGDGTDSGSRKKSDRPGDDGRDTADDDVEEPELEKGDSDSPGSSDNSERLFAENGSLTSQEAKPKNSAGGTGREDRGESDSDGSSENHGQTGSGRHMQNARQSASQTAREQGPKRIAEVLGAGYGKTESPPLTREEIDAMLERARADLDRERAHQKASRVEPARKTTFSFKDAGVLKSNYADVTFSERCVSPEGRQLPPSYLEKARRMNRRLDRILREQRARTAGQRTGTLSMKSLWKVAVNDPDVFQRKTPPRQVETVFYLLLDRSGSMGMGFGNGNSKLFTALVTAAVLEEALKNIAYTKIVAFDGDYDFVEHTVIKDFNQKEIGNRCYDAMDQISAGNGNKDGYSIRVAAMELEKRTEKRKILVVLSDGLPSAYRKEAEAISDVRTAVHDARQRGVIVIPMLFGATDSEEILAGYKQMYEHGILTASTESILDEFEKLLYTMIR